VEVEAERELLESMRLGSEVREHVDEELPANLLYYQE
jgi:hypothetical protein